MRNRELIEGRVPSRCSALAQPAIAETSMHSSTVERSRTASVSRSGLVTQCATMLLVTLGLFVTGNTASSQTVEAFYKGKQISFVVSTGEGGGYSTYAQAFAPYLSKHLPGNPTVVIQYMPGAGGIRAMMHLFSAAPKDGTAIGLVHAGVPFAPLFELNGANFDPRQMNWIGSMSQSPAICVSWSASKITTAKDIFEKEYIVGGTGGGSQLETFPQMLNKLFGTKIKIISGYKGSNDIFLAMERGEVQGRCGGGLTSLKTARPDWLRDKKVAFPIVIAMRRMKELPDVPAAAEFAKDERARQILQLVVASKDMDRPIVAPPGVPAERVKALQAAFHAAINDPEFLAVAAKQKLEIDEVSGEEVAEIIRSSFTLPRDIIKGAAAVTDVSGN